ALKTAAKSTNGIGTGLNKKPKNTGKGCAQSLMKDETTMEMPATCLVDATELPRRKPGARPGNFNAAKTLEYAHDIEGRVDGRSLLAEGFRSHRGRLLAMFNAETLNDLDGIEREAIRRLVKRRVIRELVWARVQAAFEEQNIEAFNAEVARFQ